MKLSPNYENLLQHVVDGFNRNYFRNLIKDEFKNIATWQKFLEEMDPSEKEKQHKLIERSEHQINLSKASIKKTEKGIIEYLDNQLAEAKKQFISIQSTTHTEEN